MKAPLILGRHVGEPNRTADGLSTTSAGPRISVPYVNGGAAAVDAQAFLGDESGDCGGIVIRISVRHVERTFAPVAVATADGVELHMAGELEAATLVRALRGLLAAIPDPDLDDTIEVCSACGCPCE